jgi:hypothetical protein
MPEATRKAPRIAALDPSTGFAIATDFEMHRDPEG